MKLFLLKVFAAALLIAFSSWLSGKKPGLAGFIIALPLTTMIALLFSYFEYKDSAATIAYGKSILFAVPLSCLFFAPFFLAERFGWHFWAVYAAGFVLLTVGYFIHRHIMGY